MLKRIATRLSGQSMALYTQVLGWLTGLLCKLAKLLPASFIRAYQSAVNRRLLVVMTESNISLWRANLITAVQLIKAGLTTVKVKAIQIGSQLLTTVHQTYQRVATATKKINALVALTKWVVLRINASKIVLTLIVRRLTQVGLRLPETVRQHHLVVHRLQHLEKLLVALTSWVLLCIKKLAAALILTGNLLREIGLKLQDSVRQLLQPALFLQNLDKSLAALIRLVQYLLQKLAAVLILMVNQLKVIGLRLIETALLHLRHVLFLQKIVKNLVEKIKLAQLHLKKLAVALIHTVSQLKALGLKLGEIALLPQQLVLLLPKLNKSLVALTNLVQLAIKKVVAVLTFTAIRLKEVGLKLLETANQLLQRVRLLLSKGR